MQQNSQNRICKTTKNQFSLEKCFALFFRRYLDDDVVKQLFICFAFLILVKKHDNQIFILQTEAALYLASNIFLQHKCQTNKYFIFVILGNYY